LVNDTKFYENGLQAFQEYNPLQDEFYGATGDFAWQMSVSCIALIPMAATFFTRTPFRDAERLPAIQHPPAVEFHQLL